MPGADPSKLCVGLYYLLASFRPFQQRKHEEEDKFLSGLVLLQSMGSPVTWPALGLSLPGTAHIQRNHLLLIETLLKKFFWVEVNEMT